jgi:hypothetical protein
MGAESIAGAPKSLRWIALVAIVLVGTGAAFVSMRTNKDSGRDMFREYVERLRAAGEATTLRELHGPDPAPEDNAATIVDEVFAEIHESLDHDRAWRGIPLDDERAPASLAALPPERREELRAWAAQLGPWVDRVDGALDRPRFRTPLILDVDGSPTLASRRPVAKFALWLTLATSREEESARFVDCARTLLRYGRRHEALDLGDWIGPSAASGVVASQLRTRLADAAFDAIAARSRLDPWLVESWAPSMKRAFRAEAVRGISMQNAMFASAPLDVRNHYAVESIDYCETARAIGAAKPSLPECRRIAAAAAARTKDSDDPVRIFVQAVDAALHYETATRLARVALALAALRQTSADFPASLDELKPLFPDGVPLDPFTDAPFVYEKTATGVRIASVGRLPEDKPLDDATLRDRCLVWELKR